MIVPLWALYLEISPGVIGILLGIRHLPGLLFAIHGGFTAGRTAGHDHICCAGGGRASFPDQLPVWAILVLQMIWGFATMTRMGAQTAVSPYARQYPAWPVCLFPFVSAIVGLPFAGSPGISGVLKWVRAISVWQSVCLFCRYMPTFEGGSAAGAALPVERLIPSTNDHLGVTDDDGSDRVASI